MDRERLRHLFDPRGRVAIVTGGTRASGGPSPTHFGRLDIVVNNAATGPTQRLGHFTPEACEKSFHVNLRGPVLLVQAVLLSFAAGRRAPAPRRPGQRARARDGRHRHGARERGGLHDRPGRPGRRRARSTLSRRARSCRDATYRGRMDGESSEFADPFSSVDDMPEPDSDPAIREPFERPIDRFRRTATGAVVSAGLLGLRDALEGHPEREEAAIVQEAPTRPRRGRVDVHLDFEHPEQSIALVRSEEADGPDAAAEGFDDPPAS